MTLLEELLEKEDKHGFRILTMHRSKKDGKEALVADLGALDLTVEAKKQVRRGQGEGGPQGKGQGKCQDQEVPISLKGWEPIGFEDLLKFREKVDDLMKEVEQAF